MTDRLSVPSYRLHKQSGQAIVTLSDGLGRRRDVLLGKYCTPDSRQQYARVITEWETNGRRLPDSQHGAASDLSVNELILAFLRQAETHYRHADGTPTNELTDFRLSLRPLVHLYGLTPVREFGPLGLKAVRNLLVNGYTHPQHGPQKRAGLLPVLWSGGNDSTRQ